MLLLTALGVLVVFLLVCAVVGHRRRRGGDGTRVRYETVPENMVEAEAHRRRLLGPMAGGF
jgi:hypothetical protein